MYFALLAYADPADPEEREWIFITQITQDMANVLLDIRQQFAAEHRLTPSSFDYWWSHSWVYPFDTDFAVTVHSRTECYRCHVQQPISWEREPVSWDPFVFAGDELRPASIDICYVSVTSTGVIFKPSIDPGDDINQHCESAELYWDTIEQIAAGTYVPSHSDTGGADD